MLTIYSLTQREGLSRLESEPFLKLCGARAIKWEFNQNLRDKGWAKPSSQENFWPARFVRPLIHQSQNYGDVVFLSLKAFSVGDKKFLTKIADLIASAIFFIEKKERAESVRKDWNKAFDSFAQAFCVTDKSFKIIQANQLFHQITGCSQAQGKSLLSLLPISLPESLWAGEQGACPIEWEKQGQALLWELSFKSLPLRGERVHVFLLKDLTEEKRMEQKLSARAEQREIDLIKGSLAHELNNPLAGIKTLLEVLEKQIPSHQKEAKASVYQMQKTADQCCSVVRRLLSASRNTGDVELGLSQSAKEDSPKRRDSDSLANTA